MSNLELLQKPLISVALVIIGFVAGTFNAFSQENEVLEEIIVKGIRASQERALNVKRDANNFVDAISAEDVGKLPDQNIAEALQRVTGVAIQRNRGEGDFVSIRGLGPDFVRGTINGRSVLSATELRDATIIGGRETTTGRATNFDTLPSELISTLEVIKSPSAKHVEGGIGGIVNIKTARPLQLGNKLAASAEGIYRDFDDDVDPAVSGLYSWKSPTEKFGLLGSIAWSERNIREDINRGFGYLYNVVGFDTDNDGMANVPPDVITPLTNNLNSFEEERERFTITGTAQWLLSDDSELVIDALYSQRDVYHTVAESLPAGLPIFGTVIPGFPQNPDGSFQVADLLDGNVLTRTPNDLFWANLTDIQDNSDDLWQASLNYEKDIADWTLTGDVYYSEAEGVLDFTRATMRSVDATFNGSPAALVNELILTDDTLETNVISGDPSDVNNWYLIAGDLIERKNEDSELAIQIDAERHIGGALLSSIETGLRYRMREKERDEFSNVGFSFGGTDEMGNTTAVFASNFDTYGGNSDFLQGDYGRLGNVNFSELVFPDVASAYAAASRDLGINPTVVRNLRGISSIEEDTYAAYLQVNLEADIAGVPFTGDIGMRVVHTQQDIAGYIDNFTITPGEPLATVSVGENPELFSQSDNYTKLLPSFNFSFEVGEDLYLRVAASRSLTRPTFVDMAPTLEINANATFDRNNDGIALEGVTGNPDLRPYESTNFDLGMEWYFAESSAMYGAFFYKEIDDFIASFAATDTVFAGNTFDVLDQPDNQGTAEIFGFEVGYQHYFDFGVGYILNFTFTENTAEFSSTGESINFPGVSDIVYNATLYYDKGPIDARLAYNYRSDFLFIAGSNLGTIFADDYKQLDASVSYDINEDFNVYFSALNLTDENVLQTADFQGRSGLFYSDARVGRRFGFGIRATF